MESVKIVVVALRPENVVRCLSIALKAKKYVKRYADVQIFLAPSLNGFNGIAVEDETVVDCSDEDLSVEQIIEGVTKVVSKRKFVGLAIAAAKEI